MADEQNQRPYRSNDTSQRAATGSTSASGSDPLAELARLIGQNDPFSEFGGNGAKRANATARQPEPAPAWQPEPVPAPAYSAPDYSRQSYGSAPLQGGSETYHLDTHAPGGQPVAEYGVPDFETPGYGAPGYDASGFPVQAADQYEQEPFPPAATQHGPADDDYYDDVPPNKRRAGIVAIAGIFALAVIGTAGAFGYRAVFGSSTVTGPPPVIKADQAPSKIVPAAVANKDAPSKNNERVNGPSERLVSREEQPVVVTTQTPPPASPQANGSGVVGSEPKRIRTIAIKPDAGDPAMPAPPDSIPAPTAQPRAVSTTPQRPVQAQQAPAPEPAAAPAPRTAPQPAARAEAPAARPAPAPQPTARTDAPANAPLSLNANSQPAAARPAAQQRSAAVAPPPAAASSNAGSGVYGVQVTAQRSEEEAQTAFRSLQGKFPGQLGSRQPMIKRVDAGEKGIFYGAQVGPFTDSAQANQLCAALKAAGGSCLVKKN